MFLKTKSIAPVGDLGARGTRGLSPISFIFMQHPTLGLARLVGLASSLETPGSAAALPLEPFFSFTCFGKFDAHLEVHPAENPGSATLIHQPDLAQ